MQERHRVSCSCSHIQDGNIRAAIYIICSEEKPTENSNNTFSKLLSNSRLLTLIELPDCFTVLLESETEVLKAILSFLAGSTGSRWFLATAHCGCGLLQGYWIDVSTTVTRFVNVNVNVNFCSVLICKHL